MCLAVPMKIEVLGEDGVATAELDGARYDVNCALIENARVGDYIIVHAGFAIEKLDEAEARARIELFEAMGGGPEASQIAGIDGQGQTGEN